MSQVQKTIKYLAIAFALFLIFSILTSIIGGISAVSNIFGSNQNITEKLEGLDIESAVSILDINCSSTNVIIKEGNEIKAETNNKYITIEHTESKLFIKEKKHNWFKTTNTELIIYVPKNFVFDGVSVEVGAGKIEIEQLTTKKLYFELGAGKVTINNLNVLNEAEIEGGAGEIIINEGEFKNLDLDIDVGEASVTALIKGNNKIEAGVGKLELNLIGTIEDYKISVEKGLGSIEVDNNKLSNNSVYGNGNEYIDIEGGIGSIEVKFIGAE